MTSVLPPLAVAVPILVASALLAFGHFLPRRAADVMAILCALGVAMLGGVMAAQAMDGPLLHWFGGWSTRGDVVLGIAFSADLAGSAMVTLLGVLFAAALLFAWGFFEEVGVQFHVLMLVFLAAMAGFSLTRDLFNLFVWFEVMSVAAFALTAYRLEASSLEGALNFTVTNSLGAIMMLAGIGLLYGRLGSLDMPTLGERAAAAGDDPVLLAAFCLLAAALLIKAATVPFHFWLPDAHAVAPSPVSMIFSGAMVAMGIFGLSRLTENIFVHAGPVADQAHGVLLWLGAISAVVGGMMALAQRHLKRMLAFSTISHTGILLMGLATLRPDGLAGMLTYLVGHGLVKAALFALSGVLMATLGGIDEIGLRGRGRDIWPAGLAFVIGGLLLAGAPLGLMDEGVKLLDAAASAGGTAWIAVLALPVGAGLTGGAVLRVTGRIFLGWGEMPGEEDRAPTEEEGEKANRPLWLMLLPVAVLLLLALTTGDFVAGFARHAAATMISAAGEGPPVVPDAPAHSWLSWAGLALAILVAAWDLGKRHLPRLLDRPADALTAPVFAGLDRLHSGLVGDEVAWILLGLTLLALRLAYG